MVYILFAHIKLVSFFLFQQFGPILDVEIIFNERGSKVRFFFMSTFKTLININSILYQSYQKMNFFLFIV